MKQKVIKVGSSAAIIVPKKSLEDLDLNIGDQVNLEIDKGKKMITIQPFVVLSKKDARIAKLTFDFIDRYKDDLEKLAKE